MDETEKTAQAVPVEEEEMEVSMTTQLENLIVTPDNTNTPITQTHAEESEDVHTASAASVPASDSVCKTDNSDEDDSEDSDRYFHSF